jgi:hypothetical protein
MKIIITENQNYVLRRLQQFIEIVEDQIEGYELNEDGSWWCRHYNPNTFLENLRDRSIEEFTSQNWNFFHDHSENGGSDMDLSMLYEIVDVNYGNYIRNLFTRKCGQSRW